MVLSAIYVSMIDRMAVAQQPGPGSVREHSASSSLYGRFPPIKLKIKRGRARPCYSMYVKLQLKNRTDRIAQMYIFQTRTERFPDSDMGVTSQETGKIVDKPFHRGLLAHYNASIWLLRQRIFQRIRALSTCTIWSSRNHSQHTRIIGLN